MAYSARLFDKITRPVNPFFRFQSFIRFKLTIFKSSIDFFFKQYPENTRALTFFSEKISGNTHFLFGEYFESL